MSEHEGARGVTAESIEIVWKAPPPRKPSRAAQVSAQLRARPGEWALIHREEGLGLLPWWGPIHESPDFEMRFVWEKPGVLFGPRDIYARCVTTPPTPTTDPRAEEARAATRCDMRHGEQNVPNEQEEAS